MYSLISTYRLDRIESKLDALVSLLTQNLEIFNDVTKTLKGELKKVTPQLQALVDQVSQNTNLEASIVQVVQGLAGQLATAANAGDTQTVIALTNQLQQSAQVVAQAIVSNTPASQPSGGVQNPSTTPGGAPA